MRRTRLLIVAAVLACLAPLTMAPAEAGSMAAITGTVNGVSGDGSVPLGSVTVSLYTVDSSGDPAVPGSFVTSTTSASDGSFSVTPPGPGPYFVQVTRANYHPGFIGMDYAQSDPQYYDQFSAGANLHDVYMVPSFIRGFVVNPATGKRVRGVKVVARGQSDWSHPEAVDYTDRDGNFVLTGIECEDDCYLYLKGQPVGYENGYRGCAGGVVATWPDACASPIGRIGKIRLQHL